MEPLSNDEEPKQDSEDNKKDHSTANCTSDNWSNIWRGTRRVSGDLLRGCCRAGTIHLITGLGHSTGACGAEGAIRANLTESGGAGAIASHALLAPTGSAVDRAGGLTLSTAITSEAREAFTATHNVRLIAHTTLAHARGAEGAGKGGRQLARRAGRTGKGAIQVATDSIETTGCQALRALVSICVMLRVVRSGGGTDQYSSCQPLTHRNRRDKRRTHLESHCSMNNGGIRSSVPPCTTFRRCTTGNQGQVECRLGSSCRGDQSGCSRPRS